MEDRMPTDLVSYRSNPVSLRRLPEAVDARDARRPGAQALVRAQAGYLVARAGLTFTEALTAQEVAVCRRQGPLVDERARKIVDGYVGMVRAELALLPRRGERR
jgi:hypothetical protein